MIEETRTLKTPGESGGRKRKKYSSMKVYRSTRIFNIREDPLEDLLFDLECTAEVKILQLHYIFLQHQRWLVTNENELQRRALWINAVPKWSQFRLA